MKFIQSGPAFPMAKILDRVTARHMGRANGVQPATVDDDDILIDTDEYSSEQMTCIRIDLS